MHAAGRGGVGHELSRFVTDNPQWTAWRSTRGPDGVVAAETHARLHEHHSDRGSQYLSLVYTERLFELGIAPSVGSRGDSFDNALAEAVNAAYKTELIHRGKPWRCVDDVELATAEWVAWYNQERLHEALGYVPPAEYEAALTSASPTTSQPTPALANN